MVLKLFKGGLHLPEKKSLTTAKPIKKAKEPYKVIIPLLQHTGKICEPLVKIGDNVKLGQKIGDSNEFISAPVHSPIDGVVKGIEPKDHPSGIKVLSVIIESDSKESILPETKERDIDSLSSDEIIKIIREAGIVGLGGAAFPTAVKLSPPKDKKIDTFILNGAECEPYLTCDQRLMEERAEQIIIGMELMMKCLGVKKGFIGIENNKPDAIGKINNALNSILEDYNIKIVVLPTKYPQGAEKQLIKAILNRIVPMGGLPFDVGVVVNNVQTAYAVYEAVKLGIPLIKRVITISGDGIVAPQNLEVKIGTLIRDVIEWCGGFKGNPGKVILGGPMTGIAQHSLDVPIIKGTSGIIVLTEEEVKKSQLYHPGFCINCGRCIDTCPMGLLPNKIGILVANNRLDTTEEYHPLNCIECGLCSYVCPSRIQLLQYIKLAKNFLIKKV